MSEFDLPAESAPPGPLIRLVNDQRVAFLVVGVINTFVGFAIFVACSESVGHLVDHQFGKVAGSLVTVGITYVLSVLFAFVMHRRFVFRVRGHVLRDLMRFESVYLIALGHQRRRLACASRAGPAPHPGAVNHRGILHGAELLRPPVLLLPARRRRHSGRDVAHVERVAVTAAGDGDGVELPADQRDEFRVDSWQRQLRRKAPSHWLLGPLAGAFGPFDAVAPTTPPARSIPARTTARRPPGWLIARQADRRCRWRVRPTIVTIAGTGRIGRPLASDSLFRPSSAGRAGRVRLEDGCRAPR